jgi:superfamily I DNA/RNA helicase
MLVLPLEMKKTIKKYDIVFIDECQDLSKAQRELMLASVKKGGKFIAVGDRQQAINGFCGASCDSFDLIAKIDNTDELPLSVNYRCGKSILALAQQIVPQIMPFEGAIEGEVIETDNLKSVKANDMILCRKSAPLVGLCLKFIANGKKAYVKGKDIGEGLLNLVTKMKAKNLNSLFEKLDAELNKLKAVAETNPKNGEAKYIAFKDKCECLEVIADSVTSIKGLKDKLNEIFSDAEHNSIALSTIHKSKGLEADNVFIIVPDKLPLRWKNQLEWQLEQEMNLKYVAYTRAKKVLTIVNLDENELKKVEF